jgi:hypothetical protein
VVCFLVELARAVAKAVVEAVAEAVEAAAEVVEKEVVAVAYPKVLTPPRQLLGP